MAENIYNNGGLVSSGGKSTQAAGASNSILKYPPEIVGDLERPCVLFTAHERFFGGGVKQHHIWFPAPGGIAFADNAAYGSTDLGNSGAAAMKVLDGKQGLNSIAGQLNL